MEVKNCKRCKRLFNYIFGQQICPVCREEAENKLKKVKKYLFVNQNATIENVMINCDVDEDQIYEWIRDERLSFPSKVNTGISCRKCGASITSGKYCNRCKAHVLGDLSTMGSHLQMSKAADAEPKMRYFEGAKKERNRPAGFRY